MTGNSDKVDNKQRKLEMDDYGIATSWGYTIYYLSCVVLCIMQAKIIYSAVELTELAIVWIVGIDIYCVISTLVALVSKKLIGYKSTYLYNSITDDSYKRCIRVVYGAIKAYSTMVNYIVAIVGIFLIKPTNKLYNNALCSSELKVYLIFVLMLIVIFSAGGLKSALNIATCHRSKMTTMYKK